jgi:hypothetical protein
MPERCALDRPASGWLPSWTPTASTEPLRRQFAKLEAALDADAVRHDRPASRWLLSWTPAVSIEAPGLQIADLDATVRFTGSPSRAASLPRANQGARFSVQMSDCVVRRCQWMPVEPFPSFFASVPQAFARS